MLGPRDIWNRIGGIGETPPPVIGRARGPLLVMGGAAGVWRDSAAVEPWDGERMAVNDIGAHHAGVIRHWVSLHPEYFPGWRFYRDRHCLGEGQPYECHASRDADGVDRVWRLNTGGSSGLLACMVGLMLGYEHIVLAGVPMDGGPHYFDPPTAKTDLGSATLEAEWLWARDQLFAGRVKSLSGRTRDWLGAPP